MSVEYSALRDDNGRLRRITLSELSKGLFPQYFYYLNTYVSGGCTLISSDSTIDFRNWIII